MTPEKANLERLETALKKANLERLVTALICNITGIAVVQYYDLYVEQGNFLERSRTLGMCNGVLRAVNQVQGLRYDSSDEETLEDLRLAESVGYYLVSQIEEFAPDDSFVFYWDNSLEGVEIRVGILSAFRSNAEFLAEDFLNSPYAGELK